MSSSPDVPVELLQRIQLLLPPKDAARTCILSKSWLHAWYTIPNLRFIPHEPHLRITTNYKKRIHSTLQRYHRDNMPIESCHLQLNTIENENQEDTKSWIRLVTSKSCLKDFSLNIEALFDDSIILPNELFSSQNLSTVNVKDTGYAGTRGLLRICTNPVINCVSLRVMNLEHVFITDGVFHNLLSTCTLLENLRLFYCEGLKNVKIKNLLRLRELDISSREEDDFWEIDNVPSLGSFHYCKKFFRGIDNISSFCSFFYRMKILGWRKTISFHMDSLQSVTQLHIGGVIIDNSFFDIVDTKFPLLESLTLEIGFWEHENMVITSDSLGG